MKNLALSTLIFIASMFVMRFSGLLSKIVVSKVITPYEYGIITLLVISLPGLLQMFTNSFIYEIISHSKEGKKYFGFAMIFGVLSCILICGLFFVFNEQFFAFLNLPHDSWLIYWAVLFITLLSVTLIGNFTGLFRGKRGYSMASFISLAPSILRVFVVLIAVYLLNISGFTDILVIFALPTLLVLVAVLIYKLAPIMELTKKSMKIPPKQMLMFGAGIYLVGIFTNFSQHISKIVISHDLGILYQGYFDVSLSVVGILAFSFTAMQFICVPEATNGKDKKDLLSKRGDLGETSRALFAFMIWCIIVLVVYPGELVAFLFSNDYIAAADYIYILAVGYIFLFVQQFLAYMNISTSENLREYKNLFIATIASLIVFPFFTHYMIEFFGFVGAYVSSTIFLFYYLVITYAYSKDHSPLFVLTNNLGRLIIVSLATFLPLYYLKLNLFVGAALSGIVFIVLLFASGYIHKSLIKEIINIKKE